MISAHVVIIIYVIVLVYVLTNFPRVFPNLNCQTGFFKAYNSTLSSGLNLGIEFAISPVGQKGMTPAWQ